MRARGHRSSFRWLAVGLTVGLLGAASGVAQEWLPPAGEAWLSAGYGNVFNTKHYLGVTAPGEIDAGHVRAQGFAFQLGYGLTDRLALSFGIPFVDNRYYCGPETVACSPHPGYVDNGRVVPGYADDGQFHGTFQDYRIGLDYQLLTGEFSLAPFAAAIIPSHSYVYFAHAAPGKDLHQYLLGFTAATTMNQVLPGAYFIGTYNYAFVEPVLGINLNRSDFSLEAGYFLSFLTPALAVRFLGIGYYTHGGLAYSNPFELLTMPNGQELFQHHDQIGKQRSVQLGGGFSYTLNGSTTLYVSYLRSVYGRDVLKADNGVSFGFTVNFSPAQLIRRFSSPKPSNPSAPPTPSTEGQ
jgi:hypothetical protein